MVTDDAHSNCRWWSPATRPSAHDKHRQAVRLRSLPGRHGPADLLPLPTTRPDSAPSNALMVGRVGLGEVQSGRPSRNGSTAASFSAIPQTSVVLPSRMWKTWVYFHSALEPSRAVALALPSTTTWSSLPRMSWSSTDGGPSVDWAWRAKNSSTL